MKIPKCKCKIRKKLIFLHSQVHSRIVRTLKLCCDTQTLHLKVIKKVNGQVTLVACCFIIWGFYKVSATFSCFLAKYVCPGFRILIDFE